MSRFVILEHDHPFLHWDLMLECGDVLRTWRLLAEPVMGAEIAAEPLADHRAAYLDYEGPVTGNRGTVQRWDSGEYELTQDSPRRISFQLTGRKFTGTAVLIEDGERWVCTFSR